MATIAFSQTQARPRERFFERLALAMALTVVIGFSMHWLMGRSSFMARPLVHVHAFVFMGWVGLFVVQARLAARGPIALHRRLGWIGAGWSVLLVVLGCWLTADMVMRGQAPFFFLPQHFLIANPLTVFCFAGLTWFAVKMRHRTDWHGRLHICAMAAIMGPAFGRILPMPLMIPYGFDVAVLAGLLFPVAGIARDWLRSRRIHPAWLLGIFPTLAILPLAHLLAALPIGDAIYAAVTAGHPGEAVPGLTYPPMPPMP